MIFCCALTVFTVKAQFSGAGSGTEEDPYQITNADELAEMAYFLGDSHKGTCFKLMNDIDLTSWIEENNPTQGWNPIGVSSDPFQGNFDGAGFTISGLYIYRSSYSNVGLFGYATSANFHDLNITGYDETGSNCTGGLVGFIKESTKITNCHVSIESIISGKGYTGGLVGQAYNSSISKCSYNGNVKGTDNCIGGLIGWAENSTIDSCQVIGNTQSPDKEGIGGIVGTVHYKITITNCHHKGNVSGGKYTGGIIGYLNPNDDSPLIECCSNSGDISGTEQVGGLVGGLYYYHTRDNTRKTTIQKCKTFGCVSGTNYIGGIIGNTESNISNKTISIFDSYSVGSIFGTQYVGGIAGRIGGDQYVPGTISRCYSQSKINGSNYVAGIIGYLYMSTLTCNVAICDSITIDNTSTDAIYFGRVDAYYHIQSGAIGEIGSQQGNRAYSKCVVTRNGKEVTLTDSELNGSGIGLSALRNPNTYIGLGWDFEDTWTINNGLTFPYLAWEKRVSHIQLSKTTASLTLGETSTIEATITPTDADMKDLEWTSSDETIVTVDNGTITAVTEGTATITAKAKDGSEMSATCVVTVSNTQDSDPADFDNVVYMQSFSAELGDEIDVPILLKNQNDGDITGFDFYLYLPEGITPVLDEDDFPVISISTGRTTARKHAIFGDIEADGSIHIYTNATRPTYTFSGTGGEVATISLKVADDAPNGVQQIVLRNISIESISEEDPFEVLRYNLSASIGRLTFDINDGETLNIAQAKTYDEVNYSRTFSAAGKWQALYLPFSIPVETLTANGLEVAELNDTHMYDTDEDGKFDKISIEFLYLKSGATTPNYPYLIKASEAGEVNISLPNTEVCATTATQIECATTRQTFKIKGTYTGVSGAEMYNNNYYAMGGGSLVRVEDATSGLKPQRWYLSIENKDGSPVEYFAPKMRIMINGVEIEEEETTGIHSIVTSSDSETVYTLDGQRMKPNETLPAGIYVKNHQKMIVR